MAPNKLACATAGTLPRARVFSTLSPRARVLVLAAAATRAWPGEHKLAIESAVRLARAREQEDAGFEAAVIDPVHPRELPPRVLSLQRLHAVAAERIRTSHEYLGSRIVLTKLVFYSSDLNWLNTKT